MPLVLDADVPDVPPPSTSSEPVAFGPHLDPAGARIRELASDAWAATITDQPSLQAAADLLADVKSMAKQLDGLKAVFVTPMEAAAKKAKGQFKPLTDLLDAAEKRLKEATKAFLDAERAKETKAALARHSDAVASAPSPEAAAAAATAPVYVAPPPKAAGVSMAWRWTYEVEDIKALAGAVAGGTASEGYLLVSGGAIQAAIRSGVRDIPGLRIYQEGLVVAR